MGLGLGLKFDNIGKVKIVKLAKNHYCILLHFSTRFFVYCWPIYVQCIKINHLYSLFFIGAMARLTMDLFAEVMTGRDSEIVMRFCC